MNRLQNIINFSTKLFIFVQSINSTKIALIYIKLSIIK